MFIASTQKCPNAQTSLKAMRSQRESEQSTARYVLSRAERQSALSDCRCSNLAQCPIRVESGHALLQEVMEPRRSCGGPLLQSVLIDLLASIFEARYNFIGQKSSEAEHGWKTYLGKSESRMFKGRRVVCGEPCVVDEKGKGS